MNHCLVGRGPALAYSGINCMAVQPAGVVTFGAAGKACGGAVIQLSLMHIGCRVTRDYTRVRAVTQGRLNWLV